MTNSIAYTFLRPKTVVLYEINAKIYVYFFIRFSYKIYEKCIFDPPNPACISMRICIYSVRKTYN